MILDSGLLFRATLYKNQYYDTCYAVVQRDSHESYKDMNSEAG